MFDDPGKKLKSLKDELLAIEDDENENIAVDFDDTLYEDELEEPDAVFAPEPRRAGLRTLVFLLIVVLGGSGSWVVVRMAVTPVGRFAPTPSGRMHLGNVFAALLAWLSVRSQNGEMVLRMEDLDTQRTSGEFAEILRSDLGWLGLDYDRESPPQSQRSRVYDGYFEKLESMGLMYPCYCTRSQLHGVNAPHLSDGTYVYPGTCRNLAEGERAAFSRLPAWRLMVPDRLWQLDDKVQGHYELNLATQCGDMVMRRADGVYVYQLAVTVDDGEAGVTEVVRGMDLLSSAPRQMYIQELLGFSHPEYAHVPMLLAPDGRRLSKRDRDLDLGELRKRLTPEQLIGTLAFAAGLIDQKCAISAKELAREFSWEKLSGESIYLDASVL